MYLEQGKKYWSMNSIGHSPRIWKEGGQCPSPKSDNTATRVRGRFFPNLWCAPHDPTAPMECFGVCPESWFQFRTVPTTDPPEKDPTENQKIKKSIKNHTKAKHAQQLPHNYPKHRFIVGHCWSLQSTLPSTFKEKNGAGVRISKKHRPYSLHSVEGADHANTPIREAECVAQSGCENALGHNRTFSSSSVALEGSITRAKETRSNYHCHCRHCHQCHIQTGTVHNNKNIVKKIWL